jgi:hypothetical protein
MDGDVSKSALVETSSHADVPRHRAGLSPRDDDWPPVIAPRYSFASFAPFCSPPFHPTQNPPGGARGPVAVQASVE